MSYCIFFIYTHQINHKCLALEKQRKRERERERASQISVRVFTSEADIMKYLFYRIY